MTGTDAFMALLIGIEEAGDKNGHDIHLRGFGVDGFTATVWCRRCDTEARVDQNRYGGWRVRLLEDGEPEETSEGYAQFIMRPCERRES